MKYSIPTIFMIVLAVVATCTGCTSSGQTVPKYIQAAQRRDAKTVIDLSYADQQQVKSIKAQNPQALWTKLVHDYYDQRSSAISNDLPGLLTPSCKWRITETRKGQVGGLIGPVIPVTIVYVAVSYASPQESPIAPRRLQETILAFNVAAASSLVVSIDRINAGDKFWPIPVLTKEVAQELGTNQIPDTAQHLHLTFCPASSKIPGVSDSNDGLSWMEINVPWSGMTMNAVKALHSKYRTFLEGHGFKVGPFDETANGNGNGGHVLLPESWGEFQLHGTDSAVPGCNNNYRIDDHTALEIISLTVDQQAGSATAKVKLVHSGCNEVCKFVHEVSQTREFTQTFRKYDPYAVGGNNQWGIFDKSYSGWPDTEEGTIYYYWDESKLQWHTKTANSI